MPTAEQVLASEFERGWQNLNLKRVYRKLFVLLPILGLTLRPCQEKKSKNFLNFSETSRIFLINQLGADFVILFGKLLIFEASVMSYDESWNL